MTQTCYIILNCGATRFFYKPLVAEAEVFYFGLAYILEAGFLEDPAGGDVVHVGFGIDFRDQWALECAGYQELNGSCGDAFPAMGRRDYVPDLDSAVDRRGVKVGPSDDLSFGFVDEQEY